MDRIKESRIPQKCPFSLLIKFAGFLVVGMSANGRKVSLSPFS
jgi:hypothetical protein